MAAWLGIIEAYRDFLPVTADTPVITLREGGTPFIPADRISARVGRPVWLKFEGANPTGSFKDRGMTLAVSKAIEAGARAVVCASTGNTSASAAAYAARAGVECVVVLPAGKVALGKLSQAIRHGARVVGVDGSFDDALAVGINVLTYATNREPKGKEQSFELPLADATTWPGSGAGPIGVIGGD